MKVSSKVRKGFNSSVTFMEALFIGEIGVDVTYAALPIALPIVPIILHFWFELNGQKIR